jgi:hypothetical protein
MFYFLHGIFEINLFFHKHMLKVLSTMAYYLKIELKHRESYLVNRFAIVVFQKSLSMFKPINFALGC